MLSPETKARLATLLPPTAFHGCQPSVEPTHPSQSNMAVSYCKNGFRCTDSVDTSIFTDPHFLAAAHTFQDQLFTGWMTDSHSEKLAKFETGVADGSLRAPWKDEVWEKENVLISGVRSGESVLAGSQSESNALAGSVNLTFARLLIEFDSGLQ